MSAHEHVFDDDDLRDNDVLDNPWPALGWIVLAAAVTVVAFLLAPLP
jgi:hypothetical protein